MNVCVLFYSHICLCTNAPINRYILYIPEEYQVTMARAQIELWTLFQSSGAWRTEAGRVGVGSLAGAPEGQP